MPVWNSNGFGGALPNAFDQVELLDALINCITGITPPSQGTLPVEQRWTVLRQEIIDDDEKRVFLKGQGLSGTDNIFINIRTYRGTLNLRNWEIKYATAYSPTAGFYDQPGTPPNKQSAIFTLRNIEMPFRIIANGRRFIILPKIVASYFAAYCGLYLPFATPTEFPYPVMVAANAFEYNAYSGNNDYRIGNFYDGPLRYSTSTSDNRAASCFWVRRIDGTHLPGGRYTGPIYSSTGSRPTTQHGTSGALIHPWDYDTGTTGGSSYDQFDHGYYSSPTGLYPVLPGIIWTQKDPSMIFGELDGVFYTSTGNRTTESTLTVDGATYYGIHNTYRDNEVNVLFKLE
jgi:hypothetical protein